MEAVKSTFIQFPAQFGASGLVSHAGAELTQAKDDVCFPCSRSYKDLLGSA